MPGPLSCSAAQLLCLVVTGTLIIVTPSLLHKLRPTNFESKEQKQEKDDMASTEPESAYPVVREAGLLERFHITRSQLGFDSCVVVSARYNASGVLLNRQTLYPALHRVVLAHPALSVQVDPNDLKPNAKPRFVQLPEIQLDDIVSFTEEANYSNSIAQVLMAELSRPLPQGGSAPLWRLMVVSGRTVLFAYHHAIGDGQSGLAFHSSLLAALNNPVDSPSLRGTTVTIPTSFALVPPIESLTSVSVSFGSFCSVLYDTFAPKSMTKGASAWTGKSIMMTPNVKTHVRCWEIDTPQANQLVTLCRKNNTTLTGALHTLAVGVLSRLITSNQELRRQRYKTLVTAIPISLRPYTGASPYVMCDHASSVRTYVSLSALANESTSRAWFSWRAAAQITKRLRGSAKKSREVIGTIRYLVVLGRLREYFTDALGKKRQDSLELSNLGRFPPAAQESMGEDEWSISSVYFGQCNAVVGPAVKMNVVGSPTGTVNITFTWAPGAIEVDFAEAFIRDIKAALDSVLESTLLS